MTNKTKKQLIQEQIDEEILQIAQKCRSEGIAFLAVTQLADGSLRSCQFKHPEESLTMNMLRNCLDKGTNIDAYILELIKYFKEKGIDTSQSFVCNKLKDTWVK